MKPGGRGDEEGEQATGRQVEHTPSHTHTHTTHSWVTGSGQCTPPQLAHWPDMLHDKQAIASHLASVQSWARQDSSIWHRRQRQQATCVGERLYLVQQAEVCKVVGQYLVLQCHNDAVTSQPHSTYLHSGAATHGKVGQALTGWHIGVNGETLKQHPDACMHVCA
jgi:hypothetical protein